MVIKHNEDLKKYTSIHIGGIAANFYIPENISELKQILVEYPDAYILSAGSNLLINDRKTFANVIYMSELDKNITDLGDGKFYCGASVRGSKLIHEINNHGYGGIEEMISIPGMLGGLIYMNASIGNDQVCLSSFVEKVYAIKDNQELILSVSDCCFTHRCSIFHQGGYVITGAELRFPFQDKNISKERKTRRIDLCKTKLDYSGFNFGSVFKVCDYRLMDRLRRLNIRLGRARLSSKTTNWIIAREGATFMNVYGIVLLCKFIHKITMKKAIPEICIWK